MVTLGLSFENVLLQIYLTARSCILGCRCCLGLGVLSLALGICCFFKYQACYYYYIYLSFLDLLDFSMIFSCVCVDHQIFMFFGDLEYMYAISLLCLQCFPRYNHCVEGLPCIFYAHSHDSIHVVNILSTVACVNMLWLQM